MTQSTTLAQVRTLLAEACAIAPTRIEDEGRLRSYGLDSVRAIELAVMIEDVFGVRVKMEALDRLKLATVRDLADFVDRERALVGS
ncbi:MAG: acyl carrier protein [Polyangiaceae bacterium]|nr:acyl carrier protein [Polyangiaceae bacterium]